MKNKDMGKDTEIKTVVPTLRFPEFITGKHWYISKVKDIYQITRGQILAVSLVKEIKDDIYIYPVYSSQTKNGGLVGYYNDYLYENAITWTTDGANAGDVNYRSGKFYCTNVCGVLLNQKGFSNKCMAEIINSVTRNYVSYVGNPKLMNGVMGDIIISVPPTIEERQKITDCLSSLDELIKSTAQKVEILKDHKKALMQRLFPAEGKNVPEFRFPEFQGMKGWEITYIYEECPNTYSGGTPKTIEKKYYGGNIPFIRSAEIGKDKTELFITQEGLNNSSAKMVQKGDLLIALYGANSGDIAISKIDGAINQAILCLKARNNNLFIYYGLLRKQKDIVSKYLQGGQGNLSGEIIKSIDFYIPQGIEQQKIADCLFSLDELIEVTSQKVEILKEHKKGLMQQLFPKI